MLFLSALDLRRPGLTALLALTLAPGCFEARAQTVPQPAAAPQLTPTAVLYYVDGKQVDKAALATLAPDAMVGYINVLKPAQYQQVFNTTKAASAVIVTTKANANDPAVLAFNQRINDVVPLMPATPAQEAGIAAATAYVQQHYPGARLESVGPEPGQADRYRATFLHNGQRMHLLLDGRGQVVK